MGGVLFALWLIFCALAGFFGMQAFLSAAEHSGRTAASEEIRKLREQLKKEKQ